MSLLRLENIGKIYVSEKNVTVGIREVNLSFNSGEFVCVTGKSGSGKSTLLNVISGMDSYEEGELYIEGEPTSHFLQPDWEEYREKYISFIFHVYWHWKTFCQLNYFLSAYCIFAKFILHFYFSFYIHKFLYDQQLNYYLW